MVILILKAARYGCLVFAICVVTGAGRLTQDAQAAATSKPSPGMVEFQKVIQPILQKRCYDCHGGGSHKGGVAFDTLKTEDDVLHNPDLWLKLLKNTRAGIMPPEDNPHPTVEEQAALEKWIKFTAFGVDSQNFDPGMATVRRLNRVEYHNTIRDLLGVDYNVELELPPDDTGYGFDNIGDVLSMSTMRLEKFIQAGQTVVDKVVPQAAFVMPVVAHDGSDFLPADHDPANKAPGRRSGDFMDFFYAEEVSHTFEATATGDYHIVADVGVDGYLNADPLGQQLPMDCKVHIKSDGKELGVNEYFYADFAYFTREFTVHLEKGTHTLSFQLEPLESISKKVAGTRGKTDFKIGTVKIEGPLDRSGWMHPTNYSRFFPRAVTPADAAGRRAYAREILSPFASKAFRRPVTETMLNRLVKVAEQIYTAPGGTFELGVSRAMVAALASPQFLFHVESVVPPARGAKFALLDEYSLASRLSYFLWSTLPDDELSKLAAAGNLRKNLDTQVKRMLADPRSQAFVESFASQWLHSRDVLNVAINQPVVLAREGVTSSQELTLDSRRAMKDETVAYFDYVVRNDRSILEFLDSDYIFANAQLAKLYGLTNITGTAMQLVKLDADGSRGGVLTMASTLALTSVPTRTSPVKRGKWILENILGTPVPPPPPNVPDLEASKSKVADHEPTQREILALHRAAPLCASCHNRMDPLGLALENFNAVGMWRDRELGQPIDADGKLITGESFKGVRELKHILVTEHKDEFYRTLTDKLLTYAVGRGMEYYDVPTVDKIVENLDRNNGRFSALLMGVINSAPFQERRLPPNSLTASVKSTMVSTSVNSSPTSQDHETTSR
jgi:Protein of unknown function (DUF1592)/Protein of unknown function (DUF1588)/Protein of unknown function (DUF1585)/Protein of unknown function (DUF1587)/Protein of unknown function (DUF1595)/Planctomycete cytochrome C